MPLENLLAQYTVERGSLEGEEGGGRVLVGGAAQGGWDSLEGEGYHRVGGAA